MPKLVIALVLAMVPVLAGGTLAMERAALEFATRMEASRAAVLWADFLLASDSIDAARHDPASARLAGVLGYRVLDRSGNVVFDAMPRSAPGVDPALAGRAAGGEPRASVGRGAGALPRVYTMAYAPFHWRRGAPGTVVVLSDQTTRYARYLTTARLTEAGLLGLLGLAFLIPGAAWFRQSVRRREADAQARYLADHDVLTGAASRSWISRRLADELAGGRGGALALHSIDLDNFKDVNDTLGHDVGDLLIKSAAGRLMHAVGDRGVVGRIGGDEFVIVQLRDAEGEGAMALAQAVAATLAMPFRLKEHEVASSASIGVAVAPEDGVTPERLLKSADLALYSAKSDGRGVAHRFRPELDEHLAARLGLERTIRNAIAANALRLHFQPLYCSRGTELAGFEALVRLVGDDGNLIAPGVFIPVAERLGLIDAIGNWVLREACRTAAGWPEHLSVSVNLSVAQFKEGDLLRTVAEALDAAGLSPSRLELEVTESLLIADTESVLRQLHELKAMGVSIAMDDFGTGYSSLSYLWRFPFDRLKIDRSFIGAVGDTESVESIMKTISALGRSLNMKVTVEGVENEDQATFLEHFDCDEVQGYYFGRPQPVDDLAPVVLDAFRRRIGAHEKADAGAHPKRLKAAGR